jgi:hypothetical protein
MIQERRTSPGFDRYQAEKRGPHQRADKLNSITPTCQMALNLLVGPDIANSHTQRRRLTARLLLEANILETAIHTNPVAQIPSFGTWDLF